MTDGLESFPPAAIHDRLGITIVEASPDRVVGTMPVEGNTQPFGLLHGGASCVLAESLGSIGAALHALPERIALGHRHQRHPPPSGRCGHRHRRGDPAAPGSHGGQLRGGDHRRPGPPHLHGADHLPTDPREELSRISRRAVTTLGAVV